MTTYYAVVNIETLTILYAYKTDNGQHIINEPNLIQIEVSEDFDKEFYQVEKVGDVYQLVIDESKKLEKKNKILSQIRQIRNNMISQSDWTRLDDVELMPEQKEKWRLYRQALRDLPSTLSDNEILQFPKMQIKWPKLN